MVSLSVCVCLLVTTEPIEMPFSRLTRVGPWNRVLDGGLDPSTETGNFYGCRTN